MPSVEQRLRLYGAPFALHDVRDVEAHVRALLDSTLASWGARLDPAKYDDALTYLVALCWRLSGLAGDGLTRLFEYFAEISIAAGSGIFAISMSQRLGPFKNGDQARTVAEQWRAGRRDVTVVIEYSAFPPAGAYDPSRGIAFSTYSRRILSRRLVDWYRSTFGDSRYAGAHRPLSLEQLAADRDTADVDEGYLDRHSPGGRLAVVDELNRHAYRDYMEEVETGAAIAL